MTTAPKTKLGLTQIQARFAKAVMRPLTGSDRMNPRWDDGQPTSAIAQTIVKPNTRLKSDERLEIYNRQYWFRIWDSLSEDFPGVRRILGKNRFYKTITHYVTQNPSQSFTLRNLGKKLPGYLVREKAWRNGLSPARALMAVQMATFEWAQIEAFDGLTHPGFTPQDLAGKNLRKLRLHLQPNITLLEMDYALDDFTIALKQNALTDEDQSSARVPLPRKKHLYLMVHRQLETLYYRRLDLGAYTVLKALHSRIPLEKALKAGQRAAGVDDFQWAAAVQEIFELWVRLGWLHLGGR